MATPYTGSPAPSDGPTLGQEDAARFTGLSAKTLERRAAEGEPVGRIKVGRRVLFVRARLEAWLTSKLPTATTL